MDIRLILYYFFIALGASFSAVTGYYIGRKKGYEKKAIRVYIFLALVFGIFGSFFMGQIQNFIMSFTGLPYYISRMRIFGGLLFTPLLLFVPVRYLAGDFPEVSDIIAPGAYLILGFSKIGCAVYGCCYGIPWEYGVPSRFENHLCFPVQLLESVLCFMLFGVMLYLVIKNKHRKGAAYPLTLILYGVVRFFVEFLRYYPEAERTYFFGVNLWQMFSVISAVAGLIWLMCNKYYGKNRDW